MHYKNLIKELGFLPKENVSGVFYKKYVKCGGYSIEIDFEKEKFNFGKLIKAESQTSQNFSQSENWIVLECVNRLLEKGYSPKNITLEKTWATGHGTSGRLDILVSRDDGTTYLMIECKTWGIEFDKEFKKLQKDGGQLFTYFQQDKNADIIMLYTSVLDGKNIHYRNEIVKIEDDYRQAGNVKDFYDRWNKLPKPNGVFDNWVNPYQFKSKALTRKDLKVLKQDDSSFVFNRFLEILRHNVVSDKPNAFNKIFTLFLCKIVDEFKDDDIELDFQWLEGIDNNISFQKRLTDLYNKGMKDLLDKTVTDISDEAFDKQFNQVDVSQRDEIKKVLTEIRLKKNNEFAIKEVFDNDSFEDNAKVVKEVVELLQGYQIRYNYRQQFLSDFFELLLTTGLKQESGQFFTPVPVARFVIKSIPLQDIAKQKISVGNKNDLLPSIIDYAAGSGHFLTESMEELQNYIDKIDISKLNINTAKSIKAMVASQFDWAENYVYGIEKDYRLVKTAKVSCYLHGDGLAKVIHGDGLGNFKTSKEFKDKLKINDTTFKQDNKQFDVVISNPPYSVSSFKGTLNNVEHEFDLFNKLTDQSSEIECLFIERTKQLLKDGGVAGIILPSSILSNTGIYTRTREIILSYFEIVGIAELGSNTFMATGTNTVTLFLRRRNNYDSINIKLSLEKFTVNFKDITINGIEKPVLKYVNHVWGKIKFEDYITLLQKKPNKIIEQSEIYKEYVKKIKSKNEKDFWDFIINVEQDKLLYFILAYPQKIVLVKSGEKNEEKQFLGYEFSNRRGSEGIHPLQRGKTIDECTQLFDVEISDNPEKASTYIYKAFQGDFTSPIHKSLAQNITRHSLIDMMTFDTLDFEKNISLSTKKKIKFDNKWELKKLNEASQIIRGVTYSKGDQTSKVTKNIILTADNITLGGNFELNKQVFLKESVLIEEIKRLKKNDIFICFSSGSKEHLGKVAFIQNNTPYYSGGFMGIIRVNKNNEAKYIYQLLNGLFRDEIREIGSGSNINNLSNIISDIKIPLPPKDIQEKIVAEIEVLEQLENKKRNEVMILKNKIIASLQTKFVKGKVSDLCTVSKGKLNPENFQESEFCYLGLEHLESNTGKITYKNFEFGNNIQSNKNVFKAGNVLYGKLRPYLNKVALVDFDGICSTDIIVLETEVPLILKYILLSDKFVEQTSALMSGVNLPRIKVDDFLNLKIPIPIESERKKILSTIEKIEVQITEIEIFLEKIPLQKDAVLQKYLKLS